MNSLNSAHYIRLRNDVVLHQSVFLSVCSQNNLFKNYQRVLVNILEDGAWPTWH